MTSADTNKKNMDDGSNLPSNFGLTAHTKPGETNTCSSRPAISIQLDGWFDFKIVAPMTSIFEGQPLKTRSKLHSKTAGSFGFQVGVTVCKAQGCPLIQIDQRFVEVMSHVSLNVFANDSDPNCWLVTLMGWWFRLQESPHLHRLPSLKTGSHLLTFLWQEVCPQYANKPDLHDVTWFFCWSFLNDDDRTPWTVWRDYWELTQPGISPFGEKHPISLYDIFSDGLKMLKPPTRKGNKNNQRYQRWFFRRNIQLREGGKTDLVGSLSLTPLWQWVHISSQLESLAIEGTRVTRVSMAASS